MINIKKLVYRGSPADERLVLEVIEDDDIGDYAVFVNSPTREGDLSYRVRQAYWFPDKPVSQGDLRILYSKPGDPKEKLNRNGSLSHFFYWGRDEAVWGDPNLYAVLVELKNYMAQKAESLEPQSVE